MVLGASHTAPVLPPPAVVPAVDVVPAPPVVPPALVPAPPVVVPAVLVVPPVAGVAGGSASLPQPITETNEGERAQASTVRTCLDFMSSEISLIESIGLAVGVGVVSMDAESAVQRHRDPRTGSFSGVTRG
jgi:hypothetical protein